MASKGIYYTKYTAGAYADALASIPIGAAEQIAKGSEKILGEKNPSFLSWEKIKDKSQVYRAREKLREKLDTRPGALFIRSGLISTIPFVLAGIPTAELAQAGIDKYLSEAPKIVQYVADSSATLASQLVMGYTAFMAAEVHANKEKYVNEKGNLSVKKIASGFWNVSKTFLLMDIPYALAKLGGQSYFLATGRDPWKASTLFDSLAIPFFFAASIPLGLSQGVIETKQTNQWKNDSGKSNVNSGLEREVLNELESGIK